MPGVRAGSQIYTPTLTLISPNEISSRKSSLTLDESASFSNEMYPMSLKFARKSTVSSLKIIILLPYNMVVCFCRGQEKWSF